MRGRSCGAASSGHGQDEFVAVPLALRVVVEEVAIECCLDHTADPTHNIRVVLDKIAVHPVQNVKSTVSTHSSDEIRCEILYLANLLQQNQLRDDRHAFQPNRARPQYVRNRILVRTNQTKDEAGRQEIQLVLEAVR